MQDLNEVIWGDMGQEVVANMSQSSGGMDYSPVPCMVCSCESGTCGSWNIMMNVGYACSMSKD